MTQGSIRAICASDNKGTQKIALNHPGTLLRGFGLEGDAHGGNWHRQVSLLADEDIQTMRREGLLLEPGAFGENVVTVGVCLTDLEVGRRFRLGERAVLQVTQHGKQCHHHCQIYHKVGDCVMPRRGIFARVLRTGPIDVGDLLTVDPDFDRLRVTAVTVSDRAHQGAYSDSTGPVVAESLESILAAKVEKVLVSDDQDKLEALLTRLVDEDVMDLVVTCGGTGLSPRDTAPEATAKVLDRFVPGIPELIRSEGLRHTPRAALSRAIAGQRGQSLIINLSGSPKAALEQCEALRPILQHALQMASGIPAHCATLL